MASFCEPNNNKKVKPQWYDPLGPRRIGGTAFREGIFSDLRKLAPELKANAAGIATRAGAAAADPGWTGAADNARRSIAGDYLNGTPQLDAALARTRAAGTREAGNAAAGIRDQFARNGMAFSTANQQAQQGAQAAATARVNDTETQARLANYQQERAQQIQAPGQLKTVMDIPLDYLSAQGTAPLVPLNAIGQLVSGLAGGGQLIKPDILSERNWLDAGAQNIGSL